MSFLVNKNIRVLIFGLLAGGILGFLFVISFQAGEGIQGRFDLAWEDLWHSNPDIGSPAPDFQLASISGDTIRLSDLKGHPVMVNFWATWCAPCIIEMPIIQARYESYSPKLVVLAVNAGESQQDVRTFAGDLGLTFDVLLDPRNNVQDLYRVQAIPTSFFLDSDGIILAQHIGVLSEDIIDGYLEMVGVVK